jgi:hypothetical protein
VVASYLPGDRAHIRGPAHATAHLAPHRLITEHARGKLLAMPCAVTVTTTLFCELDGVRTFARRGLLGGSQAGQPRRNHWWTYRKCENNARGDGLCC